MIIPTILTADTGQAQERLILLKGQVSRVQFDIVDGQFADNKTIEPIDLMGLKEKEGFDLDFHLMVNDPAAFLDCRDWPGETNIITAQIEAMPSQIEFVRQARESGFGAGLAVDRDTKITNLDLQALDLVDQVLLLGVKAGFAGQEFDQAVLAKIKALFSWRQKEHWQFKIGVDGGLNKTNLPLCRKMGGEEFFIGSAIWESQDPAEEIRELENLSIRLQD